MAWILPFVLLGSCDKELVEYEKGSVEIVVERGDAWLHDFPLFLGIKRKNPPQIAVWIEDAQGRYLSTVYASSKIATQSWLAAGGKPPPGGPPPAEPRFGHSSTQHRNGGLFMTTINLKDFYYWYTQDQFIEVSDEVAEVFVSDARHEMAYQRRLSRHKAQYSLDCDDGIEYSACLHEPTPQELLERMELFIRLWNALNSLPEIQGRRIDAHIILGKSIKEIAEAEGVHEESIRQSIKRGLERMKKTF